jgi:hypothetical protein
MLAGAVGSAINLPVSLPGMSGTLTVEPGGVEVLINSLEDALGLLRYVKDVEHELLDVEPPGNDPFSPMASGDIKQTAEDFVAMHDTTRGVLLAMIANLRESLSTYRSVEAGNVEKFPGGG